MSDELLPRRPVSAEQPRPYVQAIRNYIDSGAVLDLGAGLGINTGYFAEHGFAVTAVENDPTALAGLRELEADPRLDIQVIDADIRTLPALPSYEVVLCRMVLHFLRSEDEVAAVIDQMQRLTKPLGIDAVSMFSTRNAPGLRSYLAAPDELVQRYAGWKTLDSFEGLGGMTTTGARNYVTRLTAQRVT